MTDLDDALNSSAPLYDPVDVYAEWLELPPGVFDSGEDSLTNLGLQIGPAGLRISQSFDDGLPDPVTMTTSNDASGTLWMDLAGRPANIADVIGGWRNVSGGTGTGTSISPAFPSNIAAGDYALITIAVNNEDYIWEDSHTADDLWGWKLLASATDGGLTTYVFGFRYYNGAPAPVFRLETSGSFTWGSCAVASSNTANNTSIVPIAPGTPTTLAETVSQTSHTGPLAALAPRGYVFGVFSAPVAAGSWTVSGGHTQLTQNTSGAFALQTVRTALIETDLDFQFTSVTSVATATAMMITIPLAIMDRQQMEAREYFSPFSADSPIRDFERDTAPVTADFNVVSPNGVVATQIFAGQMADITLNGRLAELTAVSKTRINLEKSVTIPPVFGRRQGCTNDWLGTFLLSQGGQYTSIATSPQTRFWAPLHGSVQPMMVGPNGYSAFYHFTTARTPTGPYGLHYPERVEGPFSTAMYAKLTTDEAFKFVVTADQKNWPRDNVPGQVGEFHDLLSQSNSIGRFTCWIRGDVVTGGASPAVLNGGLDDLFSFEMWNLTQAGVVTNRMKCWIRNDRDPQILHGYSGGATQFELVGAPLPSDGEWHFLGFVWDYASGDMYAFLDGSFWEVTTFPTTGNAELPADEQTFLQGGGGLYVVVSSFLPAAELQLEAGPTLYADKFARFYPTPQSPSLNATYRYADQWIEAIAEPLPVQPWEELESLGQSTLYHLRVNEEDNVEFVPLRYFGETANMTVEPYNELDTGMNASDLDIVRDPSKTRNSVTLEFEDTRVDSSRSTVMEVNSVISIPRGITDITFALDVPIVEVHGGAIAYGSFWDLEKLTTSQISGATAIQNEHVMSVNTEPDGQGTVYTGASFVGNVIAWDSSTVTVRFTNNLTKTMHLVNNGSNIPFVRILGYAVRTATAYSTSTDTGSIGSRRERALTTQVKWIKTRAVAGPVAGMLVTLLSRPRLELSVTVMGDPRRRPGQLVSIADAEGTKAEGTWRILKLNTESNGAQYLQELQLVRVGEIGLWDEGLWDEAVWGE